MWWNLSPGPDLEDDLPDDLDTNPDTNHDGSILLHRLWRERHVEGKNYVDSCIGETHEYIIYQGSSKWDNTFVSIVLNKITIHQVKEMVTLRTSSKAGYHVCILLEVTIYQ